MEIISDGVRGLFSLILFLWLTFYEVVQVFIVRGFEGEHYMVLVAHTISLIALGVVFILLLIEIAYLNKSYNQHEANLKEAVSDEGYQRYFNVS